MCSALLVYIQMITLDVLAQFSVAIPPICTVPSSPRSNIKVLVC